MLSFLARVLLIVLLAVTMAGCSRDRRHLQGRVLGRHHPRGHRGGHRVHAVRTKRASRATLRPRSARLTPDDRFQARAPAAAKKPGVHRCGRALPRGGHRREHGDLQSRERFSAALVAGQESRRARAVPARPKVFAADCHAPARTTGRVDPVTGRGIEHAHSRSLMFERFRARHAALSEVFAFAPFSQVNILVDGQPEVAATAQLVSGNYHAGLGVPAVLGRTLTLDDEPPSAAGGRRHFRSLLGAPLRSRSRGPREGHSDQPRPDDDRRRDAAGVRRRDAGRASRPTSRFRSRTTCDSNRTAPAGRSPGIGGSGSWAGWRRGPRRPRPAPRSSRSFSRRRAKAGSPACRSTKSRRRCRTIRRSRPIPARRARTTRGANTRGRSACSWVLSASCSPRRARTWRTCCWRAARHAAARSRCGSRSAPAAAGSCASSWRNRCCSRPPAPRSAPSSPGSAATCCSRCGRSATARSCSICRSTPVCSSVTMATAAATALFFGLAPALRATRVDLTAEFQGGTRAPVGGSRSRLSQALMVVQIALSLVLLVSAGLFVRTLGNLAGIDAGFNRRGLVLFAIDATSAGYPREQFAALQARIQDRLARIPGVRAVTFSSVAAALAAPGRTSESRCPAAPPPPDAPIAVNTNGLAPNFFAAMELPHRPRARLCRERRRQPAEGRRRQPGVRADVLRRRRAGRPPDRSSTARTTTHAPRSWASPATRNTPSCAARRLRPSIFPALQQVDGNANFALRLAVARCRRVAGHPGGRARGRSRRCPS